MIEIALLIFFPALLAFAAASDLVTMTISNRVSLALVAGFFVFAPWAGLPLAAIGWHVLAAFTVLAACFGMFAAGWMGGGDAKLAAATALWLGFGSLIDYVTLAGLFGGLLTLALLQVRAYPLPRLAQWEWALRLHDATTGIPYGIALSAAGLMVFPQSPIWRLVMHG